MVGGVITVWRKYIKVLNICYILMQYVLETGIGNDSIN